MTAAAFDDDTTALDHALIALASAALAFHRAAPRAVLAVATVLGTAHVPARPSRAALRCPSGAPCTPRPGSATGASRGRRRGGSWPGTWRRAPVPRRWPSGRRVARRHWFLCAVVTGLADRNWQAYLRQTEQRAPEAERTREEAALRRAGEERLRIARELHDSLTHSISIVKPRPASPSTWPASAAMRCRRRCSPSRRPVARRARTALRPPGAARRRTHRAPRPCSVERARRRRSGRRPDGHRRRTPAAAGRRPGRLPHRAGGPHQRGPARGTGEGDRPHRLRQGSEGRLAIDVDDDGAADPARPPTPGTGLTGMRERVTALGGTLGAAPRAEGGFSVRARLPLGETV
ncbi:histidine kinase [Streptomyces thinghirensis]|nr:histidine kinase [Streptomyces thinghirensis]